MVAFRTDNKMKIGRPVGRSVGEVGIAVVEDNFFTRNETQNVSVATHRLIHLLEKGGGSYSHFSIDKGGGGIQEQTL